MNAIELYLTNYTKDIPVAQDSLQIGSDGSYRDACGIIKEVIFVAGYYSNTDWKIYIRWGIASRNSQIRLINFKKQRTFHTGK